MVVDSLGGVGSIRNPAAQEQAVVKIEMGQTKEDSVQQCEYTHRLYSTNALILLEIRFREMSTC